MNFKRVKRKIFNMRSLYSYWCVIVIRSTLSLFSVLDLIVKKSLDFTWPSNTTLARVRFSITTPTLPGLLSLSPLSDNVYPPDLTQGTDGSETPCQTLVTGAPTRYLKDPSTQSTYYFPGPVRSPLKRPHPSKSLVQDDPGGYKYETSPRCTNEW